LKSINVSISCNNMEWGGMLVCNVYDQTAREDLYFAIELLDLNLEDVPKCVSLKMKLEAVHFWLYFCFFRRPTLFVSFHIIYFYIWVGLSFTGQITDSKNRGQSSEEPSRWSAYRWSISVVLKLFRARHTSIEPPIWRHSDILLCSFLHVYATFFLVRKLSRFYLV